MNNRDYTESMSLTKIRIGVVLAGALCLLPAAAQRPEPATVPGTSVAGTSVAGTSATGAAVAGTTAAGAAPRAPGRSQHARLPSPDSLAALLAASGRERRPIVALFSLEGCAYCEALRRDQLRHLAREAEARGVLVAEFDITDETRFRDAAPRRAAVPDPAAPSAWSEAGSPAALARAMGIRLAPTLVFLGPQGELAPRLVGYASPDFFGAYLDERIEQALRATSGR